MAEPAGSRLGLGSMTYGRSSASVYRNSRLRSRSAGPQIAAAAFEAPVRAPRRRQGWPDKECNDDARRRPAGPLTPAFRVLSRCDVLQTTGGAKLSFGVGWRPREDRTARGAHRDGREPLAEQLRADPVQHLPVVRDLPLAVRPFDNAHRGSQLQSLVVAGQRAVGLSPADAPPGQLRRERPWAARCRADADEPFGKGEVVQVAKLVQPSQGRDDLLRRVTPPRKLSLQLDPRVRSPAQEAQPSAQSTVLRPPNAGWCSPARAPRPHPRRPSRRLRPSARQTRSRRRPLL